MNGEGPVIPAVGYCRVSTGAQASEGISPEAQRSKIRAWCELRNHDLVQMFDDDACSGKSTDNRPGIREAVEKAIAVKGTLVVYSLSRMSRSVVDTISLIEKLRSEGCGFASLCEQVDTTTPTGRAFYKIIAVFYEMEREVIVERTLMALDHKRGKGEALGNTPYGWRRGPGLDGGADLLAPDDGEQATLAVMMRLRSEGQSNAEIARQLKTGGYPPRCRYIINGGGERVKVQTNEDSAWTRGSVRRIVTFYESARGKKLQATIQQEGINGQIQDS